VTNAVIVTTNADFQAAVSKGHKLIRVNDAALAKYIKVMMAVPTASFIGAAACIGVAITAIVTAPAEVVTAPVTFGGSGAVRFGAGAAAAGAAAWFVGGAATWALISLGVILGGIGTLKYLFNNYKIKEQGPDWVLLERTS